MTKKVKSYFEIETNKNIKLANIPVDVKPLYHSAKDYKNVLKKNNEFLDEYQTRLYAGHSRALLIVFQGMDTSGKDGAIKHVMSGVNPQGCTVISFKIPTAIDLDHDCFWRVNSALPARGMIGIFNRSYYEEVLVTRVHPKILEKEKLPPKLLHDKSFWQNRYLDIVHHEEYLHRQGYEIIKIFLHISKDEQKKRLIERLQDPKKVWKISEGDFRERTFWNEYQKAYEDCFSHTTSQYCPWYIVPGDDKKNARLIISQILVDRFKQMKLKYPKLNVDDKQKIEKLKSCLEEKD